MVKYPFSFPVSRYNVYDMDFFLNFNRISEQYLPTPVNVVVGVLEVTIVNVVTYNSYISNSHIYI